MTKAAVFDLDGVLLDSMGIWNDLGARYLRSLGVTPEEGLNEILFSMSMEQGAEYLHTHYALPQSAAEVGAGIADMLRDFYFYEVPAKDGAAALLAALCLLVFCLLYTPCVAAIAAIKRELGLKWAVGVVVGQCVIAWLAALVVRLIGTAVGLPL